MIIQSIGRAIEILSLFSFSQPRWGISEIASNVGLQKGTVHNIVSTLVQGGFLQQDNETRKYCLGSRLFTLGAVMVESLDITQKATGPAHWLARQTGLVCRVAIWDHDAALVLLEVTPHQSEQVLAQRIGPRTVAYCSAIGRALLAYLEPVEIETYFEKTKLVAYTSKTLIEKQKLYKELEKTRNRRYAVNRGEIAPGRASIAATIFRSGGQLAGSMSLSGHPDKLLGEDFERRVSMLQDATSEVSRYMGYFPANPEEARAYS